MNTPTESPAEVRRIFADYRPPGAVFDEAVTAEGVLRPQWESLVSSIDGMGSAELNRRWQQAQQQIVSDGVTFNPHDVGGEGSRPWTLDAIPLVLAQDEWSQLTTSLKQRAQLLELILQDLYGPQKLIRERIIPAEVLFGHPGYFPAYCGLQIPGQRYVQLYAADLARSPDGTWWVTGDRTRAPFGLGYALENRIIASRLLPNAFRNGRIQRLAPFFASLQATLRSLAPRFRDNPRIALWTKGPSSDAYFEDAYLARYLGYTLVEGGDLTVRRDGVMLKTLGGLLPVEVLFRRCNDDDCDPLELAPDSKVGVTGLLEAVRSRSVAVANAIGTRIVESPLLQAYLPRACEFLLGQPLSLPTVATWWCGEEAARKHVLAHLDRLIIRSAYRMSDTAPLLPGRMTKAERTDLVEQIRESPEQFTGQEIVVRSTTPVRIDDRTVPWYLAVRSFLVAKGDGFQVMPGGLARVAPELHVLDGTMSSGERSQDIWLASVGPVDETTLLAPSDKPVVLRRGGSDLPSRVADNFFWLGRYLERAEAKARLLRVVVTALLSESEGGDARRPLLRALAEQGQIAPDFAVTGLDRTMSDIARELPRAMRDGVEGQSLVASIAESDRLAAIVRDRLAIDMSRSIRRLRNLGALATEDSLADPAEMLSLLDRTLAELLTFAGLAAETMTRTEGWRFLDLGRRIERATQTVKILDSMLVRSSEENHAVLEAVLQITDSLMTYRSRYLATVRTPAVLDLVISDDSNPRSIAYQLQAIESHVSLLPRNAAQALLSPEQKLTETMRTAVRLADVFELSSATSRRRRHHLSRLLGLLNEKLPELSDAVSGRFLIHAGTPRHFASAHLAHQSPASPFIPPGGA